VVASRRWLYIRSVASNPKTLFTLSPVTNHHTRLAADGLVSLRERRFGQKHIYPVLFLGITFAGSYPAASSLLQTVTNVERCSVLIWWAPQLVRAALNA